MESAFAYFFLCFSLLCNISLQQQYEVPEATVELLYPKGFLVSIPDQKGISLFAFHGKLNEEFTRRDGGFYSRDITSPRNDKWTYRDRTTRFKIGDTINYWLYVDYFDGRNKLGHESGYRKYTVTACPGNRVDDKGVCNAPDQSEYEIPDATVEILQPAGFSVSIPDQEGITLFAFHGKINEEFDGLESGRFAKDITSSTNGRWTFVDRGTKLNAGDVLYYWLYVIYENAGNSKGYMKEHQQYVVIDSTLRCSKSTTIWNGKGTCIGQLLLNEEFDSFNLNNWTRDMRFADDPDYEFVIYDQFEENLNIKNGELHIKPTLAEDRYGQGFIYLRDGYDLGSRCTADIPYNCKRTTHGGYALPPVFSASINSIIFFKYGRIDIRAKLPKGDWIYPQLFLIPRLYEYGTKDYDSGQIRVAFTSGNRNLNTELQGMVLLGTSPTAREFDIRRLKKNEGWSDSYHVFSTVWRPDSLTFLVDNKEYGKIEPPPGGFSGVFSKEKPETAAKWKSGSKMAPFDKDMVIKIGVGVGGHSFPDTLPGKPYTNIEAKPQVKFYKARSTWKPTWSEASELIVDYVKVYAL